MTNIRKFNGHTIQIIDNVRDCADLVQRLMIKAEPIAFDSEWIPDGIVNENKITLLQIADSNGSAYLIDLFKCPDLMYRGGLDELLSSTKIIKVVHGCKTDRDNLRKEFLVDLQPVFDTQIAYSVLQHQISGIQVKKVKLIGLNELCKACDVPINSKKEEVKHIYINNRNLWATRPLNKIMIEYAASDVLSLLSMHRVLLQNLDERCEPLVWRLSKGLPSVDSYPDGYSVSDELLNNQIATSRMEPRIQRVENETSFFDSNFFLGAAGLAAAACVAAYAYNSPVDKNHPPQKCIVTRTAKPST